MSDLWKVFSILASSYGAFGLLTQEFPLVYLNLKVHPAKPYPFKVLVTWTQPGSCLSTPFGPVPVPQVREKMDFRQQSLFVPCRGQSSRPIAT